MELHPLEANLIHLIRNKFQWGDITIECRDGLPQRVGKAFVWEKIPVDNSPVQDVDLLSEKEMV